MQVTLGLEARLRNRTGHVVQILNGPSFYVMTKDKWPSVVYYEKSEDLQKLKDLRVGDYLMLDGEEVSAVYAFSEIIGLDYTAIMRQINS